MSGESKQDPAGRLRWRLVGALSIACPVLLLLWLDGTVVRDRPGLWLVPLGLFLGGVAVAELHQLAQSAGFVTSGPWCSIVLSQIALLIAAIPLLVSDPANMLLPRWCFASLAVMSVFIGRLAWEMTMYRGQPGATVEASVSVFHVLYVAVPLIFLLYLRMEWNDARGLWALASIPWVAKLSDAGGYFTGRSLGRRPMAPVLSPKKTWEGAWGSLAAGILGGLMFFAIEPFFNAPSLVAGMPWWGGIGMGASLAIAGMLGDLSESLLKRDAAKKDSAAWIPGLGGTLDVLDSLFWAAPVGYLWWMLLRAWTPLA